MKILRVQRVILFTAATMAMGLLPSMHAATSAEWAVLAPVNALFAGMAKRDAAAIKALALPGATIVLVRDGKPAQMTFEAFAVHVGEGKTKIEDRIQRPLTRIDIDHNLAMVWAPFEFFVEGKLDHCGTDVFNLVYMDGKWKIASFTATVRKDCAAK